MTRNRRLAIRIAAAVILAGVLVEGFQLKEGTMATGMRHSFPWGLSVSGLEFFAGNGAGALLLICFFHLFGAKKLGPFTGVAAACALANLTAGMLFILSGLGRISRLYEIFLHPNPASPLVWNMAVLGVEALVALIFVYGQVRAARGGSDYSRRVLKSLSAFTIFATLGFPAMAWVFITQVRRTPWHSVLWAPDYLVVGLISGFAVIWIASLCTYGLKDEYRTVYRSLAGFILAFVLLHLALDATDILTWVRSGTTTFSGGLGLTLRSFGPAYNIEIGALLSGAVLLFNSRVRRNRAAMFISAGLVVIGAFTHHYTMIPKSFNRMGFTLRPLGLSDMTWAAPVASGENGFPAHPFVTGWKYTPGWGEMAVFAAVCTFMILMVMLTVHELSRPNRQGTEA